MIDPKNITNYNRTRVELEEFLLFAICVAGKSSSQIAPKINALCAEAKDCGDTPLEYLAWIIHQGELLGVLQQYKLGKYNTLVQSFKDILNLNLRSCTVDDLEACHGIGPKTARFFLLHSRPNQKFAVLDTHLLKYVREHIDPSAPKQTPSGKRYKDIEKKVLDNVQVDNWADFDLGVWASYAK